MMIDPRGYTHKNFPPVDGKHHPVPDTPGEGWEFLPGKELLTPGDEFWATDRGVWVQILEPAVIGFPAIGIIDGTHTKVRRMMATWKHIPDNIENRVALVDVLKKLSNEAGRDDGAYVTEILEVMLQVQIASSFATRETKTQFLERVADCWDERSNSNPEKKHRA